MTKRLKDVLGPELSILLNQEVSLGYNIEDFHDAWRGPVNKAVELLEKLEEKHLPFFSDAGVAQIKKALQELYSNQYAYKTYLDAEKTEELRKRTARYEAAKRQISLGDRVTISNQTLRIPRGLLFPYSLSMSDKARRRGFEVTRFNDDNLMVEVTPGEQVVREAGSQVKKHFRKRYEIDPMNLRGVIEFEEPTPNSELNQRIRELELSE